MRGKGIGLSYEEVIEYLSDRRGDTLTLGSHPTFGVGGSTLLGLSLRVWLVDVTAVEMFEEEEWLEGRAGTRIQLAGEDTDIRPAALEHYDQGLVLTREWFGGAWLDNNHALLELLVRADLSAPPLYPPVGEEPDQTRTGLVAIHELIGWGFTFDFDGDPPSAGRWARAAA